MKMLPCALVICVSVALAQDPSAATPPNLIKNPGFEEGDNAPAEWKFSTVMPENFVLTLSPDAHGGRRSAGIATKTRKMSGYWKQEVEVKPNTEYLLECWIRLKSGKVLMYITGQGEEKDKADRAYAASAGDNPLVPVFLKPEYLTGVVSGDTWHRLDLRFTTLPTSKTIGVNIGSYFREGELLIDDVKLVEIGPAPGATDVKAQPAGKEAPKTPDKQEPNAPAKKENEQ